VPITIAVGYQKKRDKPPAPLKEIAHVPSPHPRVVQHIKYASDTRRLLTRRLFIFFGEFTRIVIPTANTIRLDWTAVENHFFVIDLPVRPVDTPSGSETIFQRTLVDALSALDIPSSTWTEQLDATDFRTVDMQAFRLVHSRPGKPGLIGLDAALAQLHVQAGQDEIVSMEYASSSYKSMTPKFIVELYNSAVGATAPASGRARVANDRPKLPVGADLALLWPDSAEVNNSTVGRAGFGSVYKGSPQWDSDASARQIFRRNKSKLSKSLMHVCPHDHRYHLIEPVQVLPRDTA